MRAHAARRAAAAPGATANHAAATLVVAPIHSVKPVWLQMIEEFTHGLTHLVIETVDDLRRLDVQTVRRADVVVWQVQNPDYLSGFGHELKDAASALIIGEIFGWTVARPRGFERRVLAHANVTLDSLVDAARCYHGGLIVLTHNQQLLAHVCPENWHIADFKVMIRGATWQDDAAWLARRRRLATWRLES